MNKFIISIIACMGFANIALADDYVSVDYQDKQKVGVEENHHVVGANYGYKFSNVGVAVEARVEDEIVTNPSKHEGLVQAKAVYSIPVAVLEIYPYVSGGVGYKSRSQTAVPFPVLHNSLVLDTPANNFAFYVLEAGLKYSATDNVDIKYGLRLRTPFNENSVGSGDLYRTVENSISVGYHVTDSWQIAVKYAREHGDSNYHVYGIGLARSF
jgi:archaellum component FlaF (FlaF/FlaG flagellin family)